jgi:KilA-N domain
MDIPVSYKNLTEIAKLANKQLGSWLNRKSGKAAISKFAESHPGIESPVVVKEGKGGGTYAHPELAAIFVAWCDPQFPGFQHKDITHQSEVITFQRIKIQAILPFISDAEIQRQMANPMEQRMLSVANPERVIHWLEKYREDPMAEKLVKRLLEHPAQINPGYSYDKATWGTKAAFDRACDRWERFDRIIEMMRGNQYWLRHYGLAQINPTDLEKLINQLSIES